MAWPSSALTVLALTSPLAISLLCTTFKQTSSRNTFCNAARRCRNGIRVSDLPFSTRRSRTTTVVVVMKGSKAWASASSGTSAVPAEPVASLVPEALDSSPGGPSALGFLARGFMSMTSSTQSATPSKCPNRTAPTSSLRSVHSPWSDEKTCTSAPARLACTCTLSPSSCHSASNAPFPNRSMASAMHEGASALMGSTRTPHCALQAVAKAPRLAPVSSPAESLAVWPPTSAYARRMESSAWAIDSPSAACPRVTPAPSSTKACANARRNTEEGLERFCNTRTRCQV
mmetsp:Transcript_60231/g.176037  ORF Transcript_60231/g.176037 Transcript_60231/m.176037 type:complete len:287 (-) Transcript_60231:883-1743(-)